LINVEIKDYAIHLAMDFMDNLNCAIIPFDEFILEFDHCFTDDEREYCGFLYNIIVDEDSSFKESLITLLKKYPNDAALGGAIRKLYNGSN